MDTTKLLQETTPTPLLYVESIVPGSNYLSGWVGRVYNRETRIEKPTKLLATAFMPDGQSIPKGTVLTRGEVLPVGTLVAEPDAYIYIYIDGFLVNPPEMDIYGINKQLTVGSVFSNESGFWQTDNIFFSVSAVQYGQTIVVQAKAPGKKKSIRSIPYRVGAAPTPFELGNRDHLGELRPVWNGEVSLEGRISYWFNATTGIPNFSCNTDVFVYSEGVKIGQVRKNEIRPGKAAPKTWGKDLAAYNFELLINDTSHTVPLGSFIPAQGHIKLFPRDFIFNVVSGLWQTTFSIPIDSSIKCFRNGLRQRHTGDLFIDIDTDTHQVTLDIYQELLASDTFEILVQPNASKMVVGEDLTAQVDGSNQVFTLSQIPKEGTLSVYVNGGHLSFLAPADYTIDYPNKQFTLSYFIPDADAVVVVDYQPEDSDPNQLVFMGQASGVIDGYNLVFGVNPSRLVGYLQVFRNLLCLAEGNGSRDDYARDGTEVIRFAPGAVPKSGDVLLYELHLIGAQQSDMVTYLNNLVLFQENCVVASLEEDGLHIACPYTLEFGPNDNSKVTLFGSGWTLWPGKDEEGRFYHYFNTKNGYWKYTNMDDDGNLIPFRTGEHITARALNHDDIVINTP